MKSASTSASTSRTRVALILFLPILALAFQNCLTASLPITTPLEHLSTNNNGQPYDGKVFVREGNCPDGTLVESRIIYRVGKNSILYREGCTTGQPRSIDAREIQHDPTQTEQLTYAGVTFNLERPAIPLPGLVSWYYQLTGALQSRPAAIYITDMFQLTTDSVATLKAAGHTVICTVSAGTSENWNPDAEQFSQADLGNQAAPGERWLDTRSASVRQIMLNRLDIAKSKGCHGINFDAVDGYSNQSGFPLTTQTQLEYNLFLAFAAHDRHLILSLNNAPELANELAEYFDFAIAEQCFVYNECQLYQPFILRSKPVLAAEYGSYSKAQCSQATDALLSLAFMNQELDGSRFESCH